jgi:4-amino-4-deoxy-L-arabinose transferase-like glycosyltransferase
MSPQPSPSGEEGPRRVPATALLLLIAALAVLRLLAAALIPLTEDEAYYRLWAQHLRFGYYDHPPMVAWWIARGIQLVGDNALGVRLLPALSSLLTTLMVFDLGRRLGSNRTGFVAALLYNATLTVGVGAILAIPDVPASLFWAASLWLMARAVQEDARWWLAAGAAAGLACLSKYSALFLAPGVILWLALTDEGRARLKSPWPWLAAVIALAIFSANVVWNAEHHWLTFARQFGRVSPGRFAPRYLGEFLAGQFLLLNPAVAVLAGLGTFKAWRMRRESGIPLMAAATSVPFIAYLLLHSLHDRVQAHWPVPLYPAAALLAAYAAGGAAEGAAPHLARLARWAPLGIGLTAVALVYMALPQNLAHGLAARGDPAAQLRGWPSFADRIEAMRAASGAGWVGSLSYGVNGQLQAQRRIAAPVLQINERDRYADLPAAAPDLAQPGLIVDLLRRIDPAKLRACFLQVGPILKINRGSGLDADGRYGAVVVFGPRGDLLSGACGA